MESHCTQNIESSVGDLTLKDFRILMTRDVVFCDYFNKFCFLPIFGQKIAYSKRRRTFVFCPDVHSTKHLEYVSTDVVRDWLYDNRFDIFAKSKVADEYKLCALLLSSRVIEKMVKKEVDINASSFETARPDVSSVQQLALSCLGGVSKMARFREFLSGSKYAKHLVLFWTDVEHLRRVSRLENNVERARMCRSLLRAVQNKYYHASSKFFLAPNVLENELPMGRGSKRRLYDFAFTMHLQEMVLKTMQEYWVPRYLVCAMRMSHCGEQIPESLQSIMLSECSFEDSEDMFEYVLSRSPMVRYKRYPKATAGEYDEDEENVLEKRTKFGRAELQFMQKHLYIDEKGSVSKNYKTTQTSKVSLPIDAKVFRSQLEKLQAKKKEAFDSKKDWSDISPTQSPSSQGYDADNSSEGESSVSENSNSISMRSKESESGSFQQSGFTQSSENDPKRRILCLPPIFKNMPGTSKKQSLSNSKISYESAFISGTTTPDAVAITVTDDEPPWTTTVSSSFYAPPTKESLSLTSTSTKGSQRPVNFPVRDDIETAFAEILASDELSGFVYRSFLATSSSGELHREYTKSNADRQLIARLDFWRDVEEYRRTLSSLESHELFFKHEVILQKYFSTNILDEVIDVTDSQSIRRYPKRKPSLRDNTAFTDKLLEIQVKLQKVLVVHWLLFAANDRDKFQSAVQPIAWKSLKRQYSFPSRLSFDKTRRPPTLHMELRNTTLPAWERLANSISQISEGGYADKDMLAEFTTYNESERIKYRASRAVHLLLMCVKSAPCTSDLTYSYLTNERDNDAEVESDSDGSIIAMPKKRFARLPDVDCKALARMSAKEYPRPEINYARYKSLRIVEKPHFRKRHPRTRPNANEDVFLQRPRKRPKNLMEIVRDPVHFAFFKRFMRMQNSESPLLFWKSVDLLRKTDTVGSRRRKAKGIMKKFFGRFAGRGMLLQCDDEFIKKLGVEKTITTAMLYEAQGIVFASMEKNWGNRYLRTFTEEQGEEAIIEPTAAVNLTAVIKETRFWRLFGDFMRRAAKFVKLMKTSAAFEEFREHLRNLPYINLRSMGDGNREIGVRIATAILKGRDHDTEQHLTTCEVLGRKITLEYVENDLLLWTEVSKFHEILENAQDLVLHGCYEECDQDFVRRKAKVIIECFFDSAVLPKLRVNVESAIGQKIIESFAFGSIDRELFHRAIMATFPLLLHFWRRFCKEKYLCNWNKHPVKPRKSEAPPPPPARRKISQPSTPSYVAPNYVNGLDRVRSPYERVKGIVFGDNPMLHFSLQHGLKWIVPPTRQAKHNDEEEVFLQVWTRSAKNVNVLGIGNEPKMFNASARDSVFSVMCD